MVVLSIAAILPPLLCLARARYRHPGVALESGGLQISLLILGVPVAFHQPCKSYTPKDIAKTCQFGFITAFHDHMVGGVKDHQLLMWRMWRHISFWASCCAPWSKFRLCMLLFLPFVSHTRHQSMGCLSASRWHASSEFSAWSSHFIYSCKLIPSILMGS